MSTVISVFIIFFDNVLGTRREPTSKRIKSKSKFNDMTVFHVLVAEEGSGARLSVSAHE